MLQQLIESPSSDSISQKNSTASRTVSRKWLRLVLQGWHQAIKSKIKWRCIEQELLLRQCRAALHNWHRTAALESKRAHMLADHMRKAHTLQTARLSFKAWREASEVATAQSSFIIQSLAAPERAVLTAALRGWKARCQLRHCANAFRARWSEANSSWPDSKPTRFSFCKIALSYYERRFLHKALRGWVLWWYRQASGMLIAARHRQLLAATAVHALQQHAQLRKTKYAMWRAAARQRLRTLFRRLHRGCAVSKQQQCMHELAVMFHWASLARTCLQLWQQYAQCSATKQKQWVAACEHHCTWIRRTGLVHWAKWSLWQQRRVLSHALGQRAVLQHFLAQWRTLLMQHHSATLTLQEASMMRKMQAMIQGWYQLVLHKHEADAVLLGHCLEAWAASARRAGLLRFLLIEHTAIRQGQQKGAVLDAWRQLLLSSSRAAVAFHAAQGEHAEALRSCSLPTVHCLDNNLEALRSCSLATVHHLDVTLLQKAVQGWHAVVIYMARRRAHSQQAALASAERAVRKGCQAAAGNLLHDTPSDQQHELKAEANQQILQVVGAQQQAHEHRARHLLICAFYPWLEMSLKQAQMRHNKPQRSSSGDLGDLGNRSFFTDFYLEGCQVLTAHLWMLHVNSQV
ncbi:hypothetical protein WJX82_006990 [Trebouxia sp. C0006]